jgi:hypothetical protein
MKRTFLSYLAGFAVMAALAVVLCPQASISMSPRDAGATSVAERAGVDQALIFEAPMPTLAFDPLPGHTFDQLEEALAEKAFAIFGGASLFSDQEPRVFLGRIADEGDEDSIFNEFGVYGSTFGQSSIFNEYGDYGGEYGRFSPFNEFAEAPVLLFRSGEQLGVLTTDSSVEGSVDPRWLPLLYEVWRNN